MGTALETLVGIGVTELVLTKAAGSVDPEMLLGSIILLEDHINFSGTKPLFGEPTERRFVGLTEVYDARLCNVFEADADDAAIELHKGVYVWFSSLSFETSSEIRMARMFGANAVSISTVPEAIIASFLDLKALTCSVITNLAARMTGAELSYHETKNMEPIELGLLTTVLRRMFKKNMLDE